MIHINPDIFRAYDIRGVVGDTLTGETARLIGRAFAAHALVAGQPRVVVGGDGRTSTDELREHLWRGLREGGVDVLDIGTVPTPLLYYAAEVEGTGTGVMITGSHNPPEYNGLKMMIGGAPMTEAGIQELRARIEQRDFRSGHGEIDRVDVIERYTRHVASGVAVRRAIKVVVDCGNGVAGLVAPRLLAAIGCEVVPLYTQVDGTFPNHHPDPADAANMADLVVAVRRHGADVGVAFDGDGDRLGVVTDLGEIIWPDRAMMLFAQDILGKNPGAGIVFDVKCSRHLPALVRSLGGQPIMWKTGHSHVKAKIRASGALFGGEFSGHLCFADRWFGFDDAIYSAARLMELLAAERRAASEVFAEFPTAVATPEIKIPTTDEAKFAVVRRLVEALRGTAHAGGEPTLTEIDGLRLDYADGWGLVRASNTSPVLSLRFEADDEDALARIQHAFTSALRSVDEALALRAQVA